MIDDAFGHWLAGFVDGEGSFQIIRMGNHGYTAYICRLSVRMRGDDSPILREICDRTALGKVTQKGNEGVHLNPVAEWRVERKADCVALVELFDAYPLRSRQKLSYPIWREAVEAWSQIRLAGGRARADWSALAHLKTALSASREFAVPPVCPPSAAADSGAG